MEANKPVNLYVPSQDFTLQTGKNNYGDTTAGNLNPKSLDFVRNFLYNRHPDKNSVDDVLKKSFPLYKRKPPKLKRKAPQKSKRVQLSGADKKRLGLTRAPKTGVKYSDFAPIHELWLGYIKELLDLEAFSSKNLPSNMDQMYQTLCRADYQGCLLTVVQSRCSTYVGLTGIVMLETKNTLTIVTKENTVKVIPKQHSIFSFALGDLTIKIYGNHFNTRPTERAARKFKSKTTVEL